MSASTSNRDPETAAVPRPLWLLAELTYKCPLQCPYCSNPLGLAKSRNELNTDEWQRVLDQARALGAVQLGLSGGEPLVRRDLETVIGHARSLGFYSNLITSAVGMDETRLAGFREAGLDHIQVSFQASEQELNNYLGGADTFEQKLAMARLVKQYGYPMVLNVVIHRRNIDRIGEIIDMALDLDADYLELANTQYYGWAYLNRAQLLPTREQLARAEQVTNDYRERIGDRMKMYYVVPDYFETRPKACMNGWGAVFLTIAPDGTALPCHAAGQLPGLEFPNVRDHPVEWIWQDSDAFNRFRGFEWMKEPCRSCPERFKDFGGCRCQAYMLTGDPTNTDPVCDLSEHHQQLEKLVEDPDPAGESRPLVFRNMKNSRQYLSS